MAEPVTVAEIRAHLGISQASDTYRDAVIASRIITAREQAEDYTGCIITPRTVKAYGDRFHCHGITLKKPLLSVASIQYIDQGGALITLDTAKYLVDEIDGIVYPAYGETWPVARRHAKAVVITYSAGFASAAVTPESVKDAIRFIVGQWETYQSSLEGAGGYPPGIPNVAKQLLESLRDYRNFFSKHGFTHIAEILSNSQDPLALQDLSGGSLLDQNNEILTAVAA